MIGIRHGSSVGLATAGFALAGSLVAASASAAVSHVFGVSAPQDVPGILEASITRIDMRDMEVSILRTDGEADSRVWSATTAGKAVGVGWAMGTSDADTGFAAWNVSNSTSHAPIHRIVLHGQPGRVLFDVDMYDLGAGNACATYSSASGFSLPCSTGSERGRRFSFDVGDFDATVTYSDPVGLAGAVPLGDLFYTMTIEFARPGMDLASFSFFQDTDLAARSPVPLPTTVVLFGSGVLGLLARGRRRRGTARLRR